MYCCVQKLRRWQIRKKNNENMDKQNKKTKLL